MQNTIVKHDIYGTDSRAELEHAYAYLKALDDEQAAMHLPFSDIVAYTGNLDALESVATLFKRFWGKREEQLARDAIDVHWGSGDMETEMWADIALAIEQYDQGEAA